MNTYIEEEGIRVLGAERENLRDLVSKTKRGRKLRRIRFKILTFLNFFSKALLSEEIMLSAAGVLFSFNQKWVLKVV